MGDGFADEPEELREEEAPTPQERCVSDNEARDSDSECDLSSVDDTSEEEDGVEDLEDTARLVAGPEAEPHRYPVQFKCFVNKKNKVVHRLSDTTFGRFTCGVKVTENYDPINGTKFFRFPTCGKCFKDVHICDEYE